MLPFTMVAGSIHWRDPDERRNLLLSLMTSLTVHAVGLTLWITLAAAMLALNQSLLRDLQQAQEQARQRLAQQQIPTVFIEVSPDQIVDEPPENTPYYSTANTRAANPDPSQQEQAEIDGSQSQMVKTFDVLQPRPELLEMAPPPDITPELTPLPEPALNEPSDLTLQPQSKPEILRPRPRTLVEARMRQGIQVGPRMQQAGGVDRRGAISLDARASPFGAYDASLIQAVQKRWYDLIDASAVAPRPGRVVVTFTLHSDGRVTDAKVVEEEVGEIRSLYCRKAITDPAPYLAWPEAMRRLQGRDYRDIRFTFHYF
jgi:hypothetical protein